MYSKITVLASLAVAAGLAGSAHAQGVDFTPIGQGGVQWSVSVPGFVTPFNYGTRTSQAYSVPYTAAARNGCFVVSPPLPVSHGDGWGNVFPDVYSTWEAVLSRRQSPSVPVFTVQVEIQSSNGAVTTVRKQVNSGQYNPQPIYFPTPDTALFWGELNSSPATPNVVHTFDVHRGDTVRVSVCDLAAESTMDVHRLVVQTFPRDGQ